MLKRVFEEGHEEKTTASHDMDCMEAPGLLVVELDSNVQIKGEYRAFVAICI